MSDNERLMENLKKLTEEVQKQNELNQEIFKQLDRIETNIDSMIICICKLVEKHTG